MPPEPPPDAAALVSLGAVEPAPVRWLWPGYIPLGKLTVLDGDPALGKSTLLLDLAARVSTGAPMPDGSPGLHASVCLLSAEDALADTIRPRLAAAGADLARVHALTAVHGPAGQGSRPPVIPRDLPLLRRTLQETHSRLLLIDPLMAYLGRGVDSSRDQDVRRCLHLLSDVAHEAPCAMLLLRHLSKASIRRALYRGGGSIGVRSVRSVRTGFTNGEWHWLLPGAPNPQRRQTHQR